MALGGTYDTGTISVSADGTIITGVVWANGHIADPWTGGELTNAGYRIIKLSWLRYDPALPRRNCARSSRRWRRRPSSCGRGQEPDPSLGRRQPSEDGLGRDQPAP